MINNTKNKRSDERNKFQLLTLQEKLVFNKQGTKYIDQPICVDYRTIVVITTNLNEC